MKKFQNHKMPSFLVPFYIEGKPIEAEGAWEMQQAKIAAATHTVYWKIISNGKSLSGEQIDALFHIMKTVTREVIDTNGVKTKVKSVKRDGLLENAGIFGFSGNKGVVYTESGAVAFNRNFQDKVYEAWFLPA